jgi:hypothetical protein
VQSPSATAQLGQPSASPGGVAVSPVEQRATRFSAAEGNSAPPSELKAFGVGFAVVWVAILVWIWFARRRVAALVGRSEALEKLASDLERR